MKNGAALPRIKRSSYYVGFEVLTAGVKMTVFWDATLGIDRRFIRVMLEAVSSFETDSVFTRI
jgi:hypothetical protein